MPSPKSGRAAALDIVSCAAVMVSERSKRSCFTVSRGAAGERLGAVTMPPALILLGKDPAAGAVGVALAAAALPPDCSAFIFSSAPLSAASSGLRGNRQSWSVVVGFKEAKGLDVDMAAMSNRRGESSLAFVSVCLSVRPRLTCNVGVVRRYVVKEKESEREEGPTSQKKLGEGVGLVPAEEKDSWLVLGQLPHVRLRGRADTGGAGSDSRPMLLGSGSGSGSDSCRLKPLIRRWGVWSVPSGPIWMSSVHSGSYMRTCTTCTTPSSLVTAAAVTQVKQPGLFSACPLTRASQTESGNKIVGEVVRDTIQETEGRESNCAKRLLVDRKGAVSTRNTWPLQTEYPSSPIESRLLDCCYYTLQKTNTYLGVWFLLLPRYLVCSMEDGDVDAPAALHCAPCCCCCVPRMYARFRCETS